MPAVNASRMSLKKFPFSFCFSFFFEPISGYSFQAFRCAQRLSTSIRGIEELFCTINFSFSLLTTFIKPQQTIVYRAIMTRVEKACMAQKLVMSNRCKL
jgi:hypothetical protein